MMMITDKNSNNKFTFTRIFYLLLDFKTLK